MAPTAFGPAGLFGGGERYPLELARALSKHVSCELLTFGRTPGERREGNLRLRTFRPWGYLGNHPARPVAPRLPLEVRGADVVHAHHMRSSSSVLAAAAARVLRIPTAVTDHGFQGGDWYGLAPRLFDRFLTVSQYSADELGSPPSRTSVIYGGADPIRYRPDPAIRRRGVLFVGRLTPHKGVDVLIRALPRDAELTVVGSAGHDREPPESRYPALLRKLAADHSVRFMERPDDDTLALLYRSAEVLVLPSVTITHYGRPVAVSELLGLVLLEAMTSGTPVVASRVGGIPEVVADGVTGLVVEPGDQLALSEALGRLLGDPALAARMGAAARDRALAEFTWDRCAERCLAAYESLLR